ncbi:MAG: Nudix family hydrolase [Betaproteobacteria bacterium]
MKSAAVLRVAVAIMQRGDGCVLLAQRLPGTPYAGYWEFPGGKLEPGETAHDALRRELDEELGIEVTRATPWLTQRYAYPHADVELAFFRVSAWTGEPQGRDGQAIAWQRPDDIRVEPLLPANGTVLQALRLPLIYAVSMAEELGEDAFIERLAVALDDGLRLIQLREKAMSDRRFDAFASRVLALARPRGARVLVNADAASAARLGCDGVHWSAARLAAENVRAQGMLCAASCHDAGELARAAQLGVDFVVLGPVKATPSHPGPHAAALGWSRFAELIRLSPLPVYAIGGLALDDLDVAEESGAHGVALKRAAWSGTRSGQASGQRFTGAA